MKLLIVSTTLLTLATAAVLPSQTFESQNNLIEEENRHTFNHYGYAPEQEERESIPNSFDVIVDNMRLHGMNLIENDGPAKDEISIPETLNMGSVSDTWFTNVRVKGMNLFTSINTTMLWGEDVVNVESSWDKLTVEGVYHYTNTAGRHTGAFRIVMAEPKYAGNTSLTRHSNAYLTLPIGTSVTFRKALISYTKLPELFQNEKPEFEYLINNVVCPNIASAMAQNTYTDISTSIRHAARPYLMYRNNQIAIDATSFNGLLENGNRFEFENIHLVNTHSNFAKISFVQMNITNKANIVKLHLRLLSLTGESSCVISADGKTYSGKVMFKFEPVTIVPTLNFHDKKVNTEVLIKSARIALKIQEQNTIDLIYTEEQLTKHLVTYLSQQIAKHTNKSIQSVM